MAQTDIRFTFEVTYKVTEDPSEHVHLDVVEFYLREALNEPYMLEVELVSHDANIDFNRLLDQPALLTIWDSGVPVRTIHGLVSDFYQGKTGFRRTRYRAIVEPSFSRLSLVSDWRVFQQKNVAEIVAAIFKVNNLPHYAIQSNEAHEIREYSIQPGQTDHSYISRILAEEGYVYRYSHTVDGHQLLISDKIYTFGTIGADDSNTSEEKTDMGTRSSLTEVLYQPNPAGDQSQPALREFIY